MYKLTRPKVLTPHVYRLGKRQEDSDTRDMAVVTPLAPRQLTNESVAPQTQDACRQSVVGSQKSSEVLDCKGTPNLVEGFPKQLNGVKRHSVLISRGGGWRTSGNRCPRFGKSFESRLSSAQQNISRSQEREEQLRSLRNLLNVKQSKSGEITEKDEVGD